MSDTLIEQLEKRTQERDNAFHYAALLRSQIIKAGLTPVSMPAQPRKEVI